MKSKQFSSDYKALKNPKRGLNQGNVTPNLGVWLSCTIKAVTKFVHCTDCSLFAPSTNWNIMISSILLDSTTNEKEIVDIF